MSDYKTHWKSLTNPNYIGSYAFQPGEEKVLTIKEVKRELVYNPSGSGKEECTVCYFAEDEKPLILNVTNAKAISKAWGSGYIEDWPGRKITLYVKKVQAFGETVDAVRIKPERPAEEQVLCRTCGKPIVSVAGWAAEAIAKKTGGVCLDCAKKKEVKKNES